MKRTLYVYDLKPVLGAGKNSSFPIDLEVDFVNVIDDLVKLDEVKRKKDLKMDDKILYIDSYDYDKENHIVNLCFISAKYNACRNVINTETLKSKGILKNKKDGDEEKNHMAIRFYDDKRPLCLFEYNYYGVGHHKIISYLNERIKLYHQKKDKNIRYRYESRNVVSRDFLKSLEKIHRIKAVTLTIDREDLQVSDTKALSGKNELSDDADIVLKPSKGASIFRTTVENFYKMYNDRNKRIKRVTVDGESVEKTPLSFNTEQMKDKRIVEVAINSITEEVLTEDIYKCFLNELEGI